MKTKNTKIKIHFSSHSSQADKSAELARKPALMNKRMVLNETKEQIMPKTQIFYCNCFIMTIYAYRTCVFEWFTISESICTCNLLCV